VYHSDVGVKNNNKTTIMQTVMVRNQSYFERVCANKDEDGLPRLLRRRIAGLMESAYNSDCRAPFGRLFL
jgi:hypothetical protein